MVLLSTVFGLTASLTTLLSLVAGSAVDHQDRSLVTRETTWDEYHQTNGVYAKQGICRHYIDPTDRNGLWPCQQYCSDGEGVSCEYDNRYVYQNPSSERYNLGKCVCNGVDQALAREIAEFTFEGAANIINWEEVMGGLERIAEELGESFEDLTWLVDLAKVGCGIYITWLKAVWTYGPYLIPGGGEVAVALRAAAKIVARVTKIANRVIGKDGWADVVHSICGVEDWGFDIKDPFDMIIDASLDAIPS